ncbi:hypothetical protein [Sinorhizobium psoraleae]|uniref:hypothetical protein n=1 Tax=Sinorhizobium psoraleae TaxID=520838 RepID=UPI0015686D51|nr:hypothetical protein [Sinorhizobium psoraleae]
MRIFIDESGTFSGQNNISAVGALIIPDQNFKGFEKLYGRLRRKLPQEKGEVKGRLLCEEHIGEVVAILRKLNCLFEVVAVDSACHTEDEVKRHKTGQEEHITMHLTDEHHETLVNAVWGLRKQLEATSLQLYVQSCAMADLVYNSIYHANLYYSFRRPKELGEYHWVIDAKNRDKVTAWEDWWSTVILPMIESRSFREPFAAAEGGDYRAHERFRTEPGEYKKQFMKDPEKGDAFDLKLLLKEDFRFSWDAEYGLEAADILVNAVRRSLAGNFRRQGWLPVRQLMVHWGQHYIRLISLAAEDRKPPKVSYGKVLSDFSTGGRNMLPPKYGEG